MNWPASPAGPPLPRRATAIAAAFEITSSLGSSCLGTRVRSSGDPARRCTGATDTRPVPPTRPRPWACAGPADVRRWSSGHDGAMKVTHTATYEAPLAEVHAMLTDPEFRRYAGAAWLRGQR